MLTPSPFLGIQFHAIGALCASIFYTPHHKAKNWSWETYWLVQASFSWCILPIIVALVTIPEIRTVMAEASKVAMLKSFFLGMAYGIGGTAFGIALRYIGYSLTYAIAIGVSTVLGTLLPVIFAGQLFELFTQFGGRAVLLGVLIGAVGIAFCGYAGMLKDREVRSGQQGDQQFSLKKGLPLCFVAGLLAAVFNFALLAGQPIADCAAKYGAGYWEGNIIYIFAMGGAFVSTTIYCLWLNYRNNTFSEYKDMGHSGAMYFSSNFVLASLGGTLWYLQFLFYGLGHVRMGNYKFTSWAIHMVLLIFLSNLLGILLREWRQCKKYTNVMVNLGLFILIVAVLLIAYGNYMGNDSN